MMAHGDPRTMAKFIRDLQNLWLVTGKALGGGIYRHIPEESVGQSQALGQLS